MRRIAWVTPTITIYHPHLSYPADYGSQLLLEWWLVDYDLYGPPGLERAWAAHYDHDDLRLQFKRTIKHVMRGQPQWDALEQLKELERRWPNPPPTKRVSRFKPWTSSSPKF